MSEMVARFFAGGVLVAVFAVLGEAFTPKSFAGLFAAAPSVALATMLLTLHKHGAAYVAVEARSMMIGAAGLIAYSAACMWTIRRPGMPVWAAAAFCWLVWLAVAFGIGAFVARIVP